MALSHPISTITSLNIYDDYRTGNALHIPYLQSGCALIVQYVLVNLSHKRLRSNCNHCRVYPGNVFPLRALIKASPRNGYYLTILSTSREPDAKSIQGIYGAGWDASRSETIIQEPDWTLRYWILAHVLIRCFYLNLLPATTRKPKMQPPVYLYFCAHTGREQLYNAN